MISDLQYLKEYGNIISMEVLDAGYQENSIQNGTFYVVYTTITQFFMTCKLLYKIS